MARLTPDQVAEKWARRAGAASADYAAGIARVTTAPGQQAAAKAQKAAQGYADAIASGRWAKKVGAVSLTDWQQSAVNKGAPRFAQGVSAAQPKMAAAMAIVLPMVDSAKASVANMDDSTVEGRINKAAAFQRKMHELANRR